ncbi:MAG: acyl carrier protein [Acutalibacteraceae bacterium]
MEELINILEEIKPGVDWENETDLIGNHILDSLKIVQLVGALNDEFDIEITPIDIVPENFKTAETIYAMVKRLEDE